MLGCAQCYCWKPWGGNLYDIFSYFSYCLSVSASFWPARLQPEASLLLFCQLMSSCTLKLVSWHLTKQSNATATHFTLSKMLVIMWLLWLHFSPTFPLNLEGPITLPHITADCTVGLRRLMCLLQTHRESLDNDHLKQIGGDCLPKNNDSISCFGKCSKTTYVYFKVTFIYLFFHFHST